VFGALQFGHFKGFAFSFTLLHLSSIQRAKRENLKPKSWKLHADEKPYGQPGHLSRAFSMDSFSSIAVRVTLRFHPLCQANAFSSSGEKTIGKPEIKVFLELSQQERLNSAGNTGHIWVFILDEMKFKCKRRIIEGV